ncbi:MAG: dTDP-glucose 4,6-dehydratase [Rickettsiales bacterium]|jgi:dTDP-glucose 4,6-dehydratase|nr:dTDP-glucose 4,6-dehydratase [Rickettsiales bacterium]
MKNILITGGCGFIGSNFIPWFAAEHSYKIFNMDCLTYAGSLENLSEMDGRPNYEFINADIRDADEVHRIFHQKKIDGVIHFAAESHVDNSISGPRAFAETNVGGTLNLLEAARDYWKGRYEQCRFHHVSTDEVYGSLGADGLFTETTPYDPSSPYSASKAASDHLVRAWKRTYGLNATISNCSNNYGPKQHSEKLIPTIIRKALSGQPIPIYGNGQNVRDWLYVLDHARAIDTIFHKGRAGDTYNVGGRNERNNIQIVEAIVKILGKGRIEFVKDRAGHDFRYAIDASKIEGQLGWKAVENFDTGIKKTVEWYLQKTFAKSI